MEATLEKSFNDTHAAAVLIQLNDSREHMLNGLDKEAEAVKVQATFFDRGVSAALDAVQERYNLIPKNVMVGEEVVEATGEHFDQRYVGQLSTSYFEFVNN